MSHGSSRHGLAALPETMLQPVAAADLLPALTAVLEGGPPIAPLPADPAEAGRALAMLQPDQPLTEPDAAVVVSTSGSTGTPKGVVLSRQAMINSATATHRRLGGPGTWLGALPGHYVAGLMVLARSVLTGTTPRTVSADLTDLAQVIATTSGRRYLSIVPTQLKRSLQHPELVASLAELDAVLVGGAAVADNVLSTARAAGIKIVTTYGMSETSGGCLYDGVPLDGVHVDLDVDTGRVSIDGPVLFSGYRLRPELTAQALQHGRFITADRGSWVDGRLILNGRLDDVIICGGLNVDLAEVERLARSWPALGTTAEVAVVGVPDQDWGSRIVAVTDTGDLTPDDLTLDDLTLDDLREHLSANLPRQAHPRQLVQMSRLPRTSSGKIDRQSLLAELVDGGTTPRTENT